MRRALAYINYGRIVVDCPEPGCSDAREVHPPKVEDVCHHGHPFRIDLPPDSEITAILGELAKRANDADRAWYPAGHLRAELAGQPTGQTVEDLREETRMVQEIRAQQQAERKGRLAAFLAEHGVTVRDDGTFEGAL